MILSLNSRVNKYFDRFIAVTRRLSLDPALMIVNLLLDNSQETFKIILPSNIRRKSNRLMSHYPPWISTYRQGIRTRISAGRQKSVFEPLAASGRQCLTII